jgi:methionyl-tRNA formyltransferase
MKKTKIGLIVDSKYSSKYTFDLAKWGQDQNKLEITHLVIQQIEKKRSRSIVIRGYNFFLRKGFYQFFSLILWKVISKIEAKKIAATSHKDHLKIYDLSDVVPCSIITNPIVSRSGLVHTFSKEDIEKLREERFDLLIRCGSGILREDILSSSRLGLISFHHGDNRINRGGPAGFWEVFYKQSKSGFVIQQLTEELDGGNVLFRGAFPTKNYFLLNQANLYNKSNFYMKMLLEDIAINYDLPLPEKQTPYFNKLFKEPNIKEQLKYIYNLADRSISAKIENNILKKQQRWSVAFSRSNWRNLVMRRSVTIKNPPGHFLADPFVISENKKEYCFVEDFDYKTKKGCISVYELQQKSAVRIGEAITESFHMSFPFLFRYKSKIYMIPETNEAREIRLYECTDFPTGWQLSKVLMSDVSATDTMIFERDGVWWMFTNIDPADVGDHNSELYIFYSENPLSSSWVAHSKNPIYIDPDKSRNAGLLIDNCDIFRVSQKMGFQQYGKGFSINKVTLLNKNLYEEESECEVEPNFFKNLKGTHHIHSNGNVTVFDYVASTTLN